MKRVASTKKKEVDIENNIQLSAGVWPDNWGKPKKVICRLFSPVIRKCHAPQQKESVCAISWYMMKWVFDF